MVAARETTLQELLEGSKQYQVPLYQRTFSWKKDQLRRLWEDILKLAEDRTGVPALTHFIGSLVLAPSPANGPAGVQEFLVVDGQQRLTTLSLLLCALRDHRAQQDQPAVPDQPVEIGAAPAQAAAHPGRSCLIPGLPGCHPAGRRRRLGRNGVPVLPRPA
jgi:Protein of unknown function DUF262